MNRNKSQQASIKLVGAGLFAVAGIVLALIFSGVIEIFPPEPPPTPPEPTILSSNGNEYRENGNYVYKVFATVRNEGGDGWIRVYVNLTKGWEIWQKYQRLFLANLEDKTVEFKFATMYGNFTIFDTYDFAIWSEAD